MPEKTTPAVRASNELHLYLLAAKMSESLKFGVTALIAATNDNNHSGARQRMWSLLYLAAALNEIRDWAKAADDGTRRHPVIAAGLEGLNSISKDSELEATLGKLRNQVVFHHDLAALATTCRDLPSEMIIVAQGSSNAPLTSTWDLAQILVLTFGLGLTTDLTALRAQVPRLIEYVNVLAKGFVVATETALIANRDRFGLLLVKGNFESTA